MKSKILITAMLFASLAQAKEPKVHQNGTLLQMDSAECGVDENSGKSVVGELVGTDSAHKKTHALLCQEYLLQSETVIYRIRPRDEKHPVLLPVGQKGPIPHSEGQDVAASRRRRQQGTGIQRSLHDAAPRQIAYPKTCSRWVADAQERLAYESARRILRRT